MRYGISRIYSYNTNLGELMQLLGTVNGYKKMGIDESELLDVSYGGLSKYDGEYVLMPMARYIGNYRDTHYPSLSPKIIPAFVGLHASDCHCIEDLRRYQHFGPFGCRDMETMKFLRNAGFDAYTSGCMSLLHPRRVDTGKEYKKIFFIDVPEEFMPFVPEEIMEQADFSLSHLWKSTDSSDIYETSNESISYLRAMIDKVCNEAKLIVTYRIHVSLPYTAMGIPVITVLQPGVDLVDERLSGYSGMLNIYTSKDYGNVNWNPPVPDIEDRKQKVFNAFKTAVKRNYEKYSDLCDASDCMEKDEKEMPQVYYNGEYDAYLTLQDKLNWVHRNNDTIFIKDYTLLEHITGKALPETNIVLFGAGSAARWLVKRFDPYFIRAKSFEIVDNDESRVGRPLWEDKSISDELVNNDLKARFQNALIAAPTAINKYLDNKKNLLVIIATGKYKENASIAISKQLIEQFGLREGMEFYFLDKLNNSMNLPLCEEARMFSEFEAL